MSASGTFAFTLTQDEALALQKLVSIGIDKGLNVLSEPELVVANHLYGRVVEIWGRVIQRQAVQPAEKGQ